MSLPCMGAVTKTVYGHWSGAGLMIYPVLSFVSQALNSKEPCPTVINKVLLHALLSKVGVVLVKVVFWLLRLTLSWVVPLFHRHKYLHTLRCAPKIMPQFGSDAD